MVDMDIVDEVHVHVVVVIPVVVWMIHCWCL